MIQRAKRRRETKVTKNQNHREPKIMDSQNVTESQKLQKAK